MIAVSFQLQVAGTPSLSFAAPTPNFFQVANAGIQILVQLLDEDQEPLNISGATALTLAFQLPDGTLISKTASYLSNGIDGQIYYVTTASDFIEAGLTYVQAQVTVGGATLTTAWAIFTVHANL